MQGEEAESAVLATVRAGMAFVYRVGFTDRSDTGVAGSAYQAPGTGLSHCV